MKVREMRVRSRLVELVPFAAMVAVECLDVGLTTLSKAAMSKGMSHFVFVVYTCFGFYHSSSCCFSLHNVLHYLSTRFMLLEKEATNYFIFAVQVLPPKHCWDGRARVESSKSQSKILGTLVSVSGAVVITFYKGPLVLSPSAQPYSQPSSSTILTTPNNWIIGGLFIATACLSLSTNIIGQAVILKGYPSVITLVSFYCLFGTIQCGLVALITERNPNAWKLSPDIELISVVYPALFGSVVTFSMIAWCIRWKGPVFVAMFKPLSIAIAAFLGFIFLGETLYVGRNLSAY